MPPADRPACRGRRWKNAGQAPIEVNKAIWNHSRSSGRWSQMKNSVCDVTHDVRKVFQGVLCQQDAVSSVNLRMRWRGFFSQKGVRPREECSVKTDITVTVRAIIPSTKYVFWNPRTINRRPAKVERRLHKLFGKLKTYLINGCYRVSNTAVIYLNAPTEKTGISKSVKYFRITTSVAGGGGKQETGYADGQDSPATAGYFLAPMR